jgi:uncharacterized protein HemX
MSKQNKPAEKQESQKPDDKNKKELSWGERMAEQIAGDNEMMKGAIKFLTHPLVLFTGGIAILFWLFKGKEQKDIMEKLQKENEEMKQTLKGIEKEISELKAEQKNIQQKLSEAPKENIPMLGTTQYRQKALSSGRRYTNAYLD